MKKGYLESAAYEIYKAHWIETHISFERRAKAIASFYFGCDEDSTMENDYYDATDYIDEVGYDGEIYAGKSEFVENEFQDKEFMRELLPDALYKEYLAYQEEESEKLS